MKYLYFEIENYRAIKGPLRINVSKQSLIPIIGINECGKTTILQAIFSFDHLNDSLYQGRHLKDVANLYEKNLASSVVIRAAIQMKVKQLSEIYDLFIEKMEDFQSQIESGEMDETDTDYMESLDDNLLDEWRAFEPTLNKDQAIVIERDLLAKKHQYRIKDFDKSSIFDSYFHSYLAQEILSYCPHIIYNDDFMDRPPSKVIISQSSNTEWYKIYNQCYLDCMESGKLLDIVQIKDSRRVASILSEMEDKINKKLSKAWKTFSLANHNSLEVKLSIDGNEQGQPTLEISIVEKVDGKNKHFYVSDRSKGFLWFFNFVMKLEFNPKIVGDKRNTIYLLDEPGSYLHFSAQEKLCNKLVEISKDSGVVIYCTHSHTLLDPKKIPLHSIYVVEKDKKKSITAKPLNQISTKLESSSAFQPLHEALELSAFDFKMALNVALCVEGIYDKYAIELFCKIEGISVFPSTGGESIMKNIQYFIGYGVNYIALWDNDDAGRLYYDKAKQFFGEEESKKFLKLPLVDRKNVRMEEMFTSKDFNAIRDLLELPNNSSYEKIILMLYFSERSLQQKAAACVESETSERFRILQTNIESIKKTFN